MAIITTWQQCACVVRNSSNSIVIEVGDDGLQYLRLNHLEAVKLRDDLSRAITEAATAPKAVQPEGEPA